jgi:IclR-like helix-turn-helix domain-containing protein
VAVRAQLLRMVFRHGRSRVAGGSVQSVDRAITVLQVLARHGTAGVIEVAGELGRHRSTAFRLHATSAGEMSQGNGRPRRG